MNGNGHAAGHGSIDASDVEVAAARAARPVRLIELERQIAASRAQCEEFEGQIRNLIALNYGKGQVSFGPNTWGAKVNELERQHAAVAEGMRPLLAEARALQSEHGERVAEILSHMRRENAEQLLQALAALRDCMAIEHEIAATIRAAGGGDPDLPSHLPTLVDLETRFRKKAGVE